MALLLNNTFYAPGDGNDACKCCCPETYVYPTTTPLVSFDIVVILIAVGIIMFWSRYHIFPSSYRYWDERRKARLDAEAARREARFDEEYAKRKVRLDEEAA